MPMSLAPVIVVPRTSERVLTAPMALSGLTLLAAAFVRISGLDRAGMSFCYFKTVTGYACMTCGTTRAFGHLAHFDLPRAFAVQPLMTLATLGLLAWGLTDTLLLLAGRRTTLALSPKAMTRACWFVLALALINWGYLLATGV